MGAGRHPVNPGGPAGDYVGRGEKGQSLEPKARCLGLPVPKLPRVDDLIRTTDRSGDQPDRIFQGYPGDGGTKEHFDEIESLFLFSRFLLCGPPPGAGTA